MRTLSIAAIFSLLGMFVTPEAGAQQPAHLLKDIHPGIDRAQGLSPQDLTPFGNSLYFIGSEDFNGRALWKTDGTAAGTRLTVDLEPFDGGVISLGAQRLVAAGNRLYVVSRDSPFRLWVSDGTGVGTRLVAEMANGSLIAGVGSFAIFSAWQPDTGTELWASDGTAGGAQRLDLVPGPGSPNAGSFVVASGLLYFQATVNNQAGLWRTDGTPAGTIRLGNAISRSGTATLGDRLFFAACDSVHGCEPWTSDGTPDGTRRVADLWPGSGSSFWGEFVVVDETVFFAATTSEGHALWKTDAAGSTATLVKRVPLLGSFGLRKATAAAADGVLYFLGSDPLLSHVLWRSDGTEEGTQLVADLPDRPPNGELWIDSFAGSGGSIFFAVTEYDYADFEVKYELWSSNGTQAGTRRLASLDWPPTEIISAFSRVFFNGITDETGSELWTSDGTVAGTIPLDFAPAANAWPYLLTSTGTRLFTLVELKVAEPRDYRSLLWQSDGTSDGTVAVPGVASGNINGMVAASGRLVFTQYMPGGGTEMWSTDGTEQGLTRLADFVGSLSHSDPVTTLYFPRQNSDSRSWELWKSDGTSSGTVFVKALSLEWPDPGAFQEIDNLVYFRVCTRANGCEPWVTDGTTDGTRMIRDLIPGSASSYPSDFTSLNGHVLFSGNGRTLWKTDGTESGTALVRQIEGSDGYIHGITALPDRVVFGVGGYGAANQLWTSDGTTEGTMRIATFAGPADAIATNFARLGNLILFTVDDGVHGRELWKTDGTAGGTTLLKDVNPGPRSMNEGFGYDTFAVSGLRLVFTASDPEHGSEVFITDGTTEGTRLLTDINPGPASSNAYEIEIVGPRLFVAAGRPDVGYELFTVVLSAGDALDDLARQLDSLGFARGTAQSLKAKLQAADQAIDRDDHQTAMNILEAFITELLALRGKKLSEPDADALISAARQIIEAL